MSSRERYLTWEKDNIPEWLPANGPARLFASHAWQAAEAETARRCAELAEKLAIHYRDVYKNRVPSDDQAYHPHTDGLSDGAAQIEEAIKYVFPEAFK